MEFLIENHPSYLDFNNLESKLYKILERSTDIEKTIKSLQYIFNIRNDNIINKYYNNPLGGIITIGNNKKNAHNLNIYIIKKESKFYLNIGLNEYTNNISIPLDKIKTMKGGFPSKIHLELEYEKPYLCIYIKYLKKILRSSTTNTENTIIINPETPTPTSTLTPSSTSPPPTLEPLQTEPPNYIPKVIGFETVPRNSKGYAKKGLPVTFDNNNSTFSYFVLGPGNSYSGRTLNSVIYELEKKTHIKKLYMNYHAIKNYEPYTLTLLGENYETIGRTYLLNNNFNSNRRNNMLPVKIFNNLFYKNIKYIKISAENITSKTMHRLFLSKITINDIILSKETVNELTSQETPNYIPKLIGYNSVPTNSRGYAKNGLQVTFDNNTSTVSYFVLGPGNRYAGRTLNSVIYNLEEETDIEKLYMNYSAIKNYNPYTLTLLGENYETIGSYLLNNISNFKRIKNMSPIKVFDNLLHKNIKYIKISAENITSKTMHRLFLSKITINDTVLLNNTLKGGNKKEEYLWRTEEGYLDINGDIIKVLIDRNDKNKLNTFKNNNMNINFEVYFPAYKNPWCTIGSIKNEDIKTFLDKSYKTNRMINNITFNNYTLNTNKLLSIINDSKKINLLKTDSLVFNITNILDFSTILTSFGGGNMISELFNIDGSTQKLKVFYVNGRLIIKEYNIKHIIHNSNNTYSYNTNDKNNFINTICDIKINLSIKSILEFEFMPITNHHALTIHKDNIFIEHIPHINLYPYLDSAQINKINNSIELKYNKVANIIKYRLPNQINSNHKWLIGEPTSIRAYRGEADKIVRDYHRTYRYTVIIYIKLPGGTPPGFNPAYPGEGLFYSNSYFRSRSAAEAACRRVQGTLSSSRTMNYKSFCRDAWYSDRYGYHMTYYTRGCGGRGWKVANWYNGQAMCYAPWSTGPYIHNNAAHAPSLGGLSHSYCTWTLGFDKQIEGNNRAYILSSRLGRYLGNNAYWTISGINTNYLRNGSWYDVTIRNSSNSQYLSSQQGYYGFNYSWWPQTIKIKVVSINRAELSLRVTERTVIEKREQMPYNIFGSEITPYYYKSNKFDNLTVQISSNNITNTEKLKPKTLLMTNLYNNSTIQNYPTSLSQKNTLYNKYKNKYFTINESGDKEIYYEFNNPIQLSEIKIHFNNKRNTDIYTLDYFDELNQDWVNIYKKKTTETSTGIKIIDQEIENKYAYKFKFIVKTTKSQSSEQNELYQILMRGYVKKSYPYITNKNYGVAEVKKYNNTSDKVHVNYIKDNYGTWIKVGIFKKDAKDTIKNSWSSIEHLSIAIDQIATTAFSADFGEMRTSEVRILGATDFNNWVETKTIDWIYKVPKDTTNTNKYIPFKHFFGKEGNVYGEGRYGFYIDGSYDGRGRWINNNKEFIGISNSSYSNPSNIYNREGSGFYWNSSSDAKLVVMGPISNKNYETNVGQDYYSTSGFGNDDGATNFFDYNYNTEELSYYSSNMYNNGNGKEVKFSSAVWVLLKLDDLESSEFKIESDTKNILKQDLNRRIVRLEKNIVKIKKDINEMKTVTIVNKQKEIDMEDKRVKNLAKGIYTSKILPYIDRIDISFNRLKNNIDQNKNNFRAYNNLVQFPNYQKNNILILSNKKYKLNTFLSLYKSFIENLENKSNEFIKNLQNLSQVHPNFYNKFWRIDYRKNKYPGWTNNPVNITDLNNPFNITESTVNKTTTNALIKIIKNKPFYHVESQYRYPYHACIQGIGYQGSRPPPSSFYDWRWWLGATYRSDLNDSKINTLYKKHLSNSFGENEGIVWVWWGNRGPRWWYYKDTPQFCMIPWNRIHPRHYKDTKLVWHAPHGQKFLRNFINTLKNNFNKFNKEIKDFKILRELLNNSKTNNITSGDIIRIINILNEFIYEYNKTTDDIDNINSTLYSHKKYLEQEKKQLKNIDLYNLEKKLADKEYELMLTKKKLSLIK